MRAYLTPLIFFQRFFIPALIIFLFWALWRVVSQKDRGVGVALYVALVVIVDAYLNTGIYLPGLEKGSIRYSEVCALLLYFNTTPSPSAVKMPRAVYWLVSLYFVMLFASTLHSDSLVASLLEFRQIIFPQIVAVLVAKRGLDSPQAYRRFFLCISALAVIVGVFVFWDLFFDRVFLHSDTLNKGIYFHNRKLNRFGSFFLNPNYLGAFVGLVFPIMFVWTLKEKAMWPRLLSVTALLSLLFCLVETQSRAPMLAFAIGTMFLVVGPSGEVSRARRLGFLAIFIAAFFVVMPGFFQHAIGRFDRLDEETTTESGRSRATTWLYTIRMINDHPFTGIGFGEPQFMKYMDLYGYGDEFGGESLDAPHNSYLQVAVYAGIPALVVFVVANILLLWRSLSAMLRGRDDDVTAMMFGFSVGIFAFLLSIYPDIQLFTASVAPLYWVCFGLLHSLTAAGLQPVLATSAVAPSVEPVEVLSWWSTHPAGSASRSQIAPTTSRGSRQHPREDFFRARRDVPASQNR